MITRRHFLKSSLVVAAPAIVSGQSAYAAGGYFETAKWGVIGSINHAPIVNSIYDVKWATKQHVKLHIKGLTGTWMDTVPGRKPGGFNHRIAHGHHLFKDGWKVFRSSELKFGEFLHHLGMDSLSKAGIPIPFLPTGALLTALRRTSLPAKMAQEFLTVNVPKILGGGVSFLVAGHDVYACFADTIPHTFAAAGWRMVLSALDFTCCFFPPNPTILLYGVAELGVGLTTGIRTISDFIIPLNPMETLIKNAAVYFPLWAETALVSALLGACVGYWNGKDWETVAKDTGITFTGALAYSAASTALNGHLIAPFVGAAAGLLTGMLLRQIFITSKQEYRLGEVDVTDYFEKSDKYFDTPDKHFDAPKKYFDTPDKYFDAPKKYFDDGFVLPMWQPPDKPIGTFKDGELILDREAIVARLDSQRN